MLRGTDISSYQDAIPDGGFTILKATEGLTYDDTRFAHWWKQLGSAGRCRGAYHFGHPSNDPVREADHFLGIVESVGLKRGDVLVLDHEVTDGTSAAHCAAWARAWCSHIHGKTGWPPVVYTFLSFAQEGRCDGLGGYALWIADPSRPAGQPRVPHPWSDWAIHQYSETGGIDHDIAKGGRAEFLALGGLKPAPTPDPQEDDMPYCYTGQLADGAGAITPISIRGGSCTAVGFAADNGLQQLPAAKLRVAIHDAHGWDVHHLVADSAKPKTWIKFRDAGTTDEISVQREDDGAVHVAWDAS